MKVAALILVAAVAAPAPAYAADSAASLFRSGDFAKAAVAYRAVLAANASDVDAEVGLGTIELYQNDLAAAEPLLRAAVAANPENVRAVKLLAELTRRKDEAARFSAVAGLTAYVPFVAGDPLPVVRVVANGTAANFVVDTGGDVDLDPDFAAKIGVKTQAAGNGTFAGGKQAPVRQGMLNALSVGAATARDVPVHVLASNASALFPNLRVDGILGTTYFERFLVTIDYPHDRLIFRARSAQSSASFEAASGSAAVVPCYLAGDHFVLARAQVNDAPEGLFLFDSGLAGGGLTPSPQLVDAAGIALDRSNAGTGMGGGGAVTVIPFVAHRVAVGTAVQADVRGLFTPEGSPLAIFPFTVWGIVSDQFLRHYAYTVDFDAMKIVLAGKDDAR